MADAKRCDLCGQFYLGSKRGVNRVCIYNSNDKFNTTRMPNLGNSFDVCPACGAAFMALYYSRMEAPK